MWVQKSHHGKTQIDYFFQKDGDYFGAESTQSTEVHNNKHFPVETILCALSSDISELFEKDTM